MVDHQDAEISQGRLSEIIAMAWDDQTSFENIEAASGLKEKEIILLMRENMKSSSFRMWRKRVSGRRTKHAIRNLNLVY